MKKIREAQEIFLLPLSISIYLLKPGLHSPTKRAIPERMTRDFVNSFRFSFQFTASFNCLPGLKAGTRLASI
jgi:hypothetical protein